VTPTAVLTPTLELCLAVGLVLSTPSLLPLTMAVTVGLLSVFTIWLISVYARGLRLRCGCFGAGGAKISLRTILRNIFFITLGCCGLLLALHISGAALGGAAIGGILGWLGSLFLLATWRLEIIVPLTAFALWQSLSKRPLRLGCQRQVPRQWNQTLPPGSRYFFWGLLLGSGVITIIPYSSFLVVLGVQLTSGTLLGCLSGALFGSTREAMALILSLHRQIGEPKPSKMMGLLPALQATITQLNIAWILGGCIILLITNWR
jgi:hypothetical protein